MRISDWSSDVCSSDLIFAPGRLNAITDVEGVRVGQVTLKRGDNVRTGITAIFPHAGNAYLSRVPAAVHVGNGFGKFVGTTQVAELGELDRKSTRLNSSH